MLIYWIGYTVYMRVYIYMLYFRGWLIVLVAKNGHPPRIFCELPESKPASVCAQGRSKAIQEDSLRRARDEQESGGIAASQAISASKASSHDKAHTSATLPLALPRARPQPQRRNTGRAFERNTAIGDIRRPACVYKCVRVYMLTCSCSG